MTRITPRVCTLCVAPLLLAGAVVGMQRSEAHGKDIAMQDMPAQIDVHFLEIVTPAMDATCEALSKVHGVEFGDPIAEIGNARTAQLSGGGLVSVRAPMHGAENPVVRPYVLVDDIDAAVKAAGEAGAQIAIPRMEIPGHGTIAIYILGGIEHGLWQR